MQPTYLKPWWMSDSYHVDDPIPDDLERLSGPRGPAMIRAYDDGRTEPGWGLPKKHDRDFWFTPLYNQNKFNGKRAVRAYALKGQPFAYVMRSLNVICIDIDGKNGGFDHVGRLGPLPDTMAETSKSGNGYHLFYATDDTWDDEFGFQGFSDRISIQQGVDIRGVGCVYHYPTQRWNGRPIAMLPKALGEMLVADSAKKQATTDRIKKVLSSQEEHEVLMLQDELRAQLAKPIKSGNRNNTLFAIGSQMKQAQIAGWEDDVHERAIAVGLGQDEAEKLVRNIESYA